MLNLFKNKEKEVEDNHEIISIINKYGSDSKNILEQRSKDKNLKKRDRLHWRRLSKKISNFT